MIFQGLAEAHRSRSTPSSGTFPGAAPTTPRLTLLTCFTTPLPLASHPGRFNRQTAPRGTGEGFRFCSKPTHPAEPVTH